MYGWWHDHLNQKLKPKWRLSVNILMGKTYKVINASRHSLAIEQFCLTSLDSCIKNCSIVKQ